MAALEDIVEFCDRELKISEIPDYPTAHNGLQLQNAGKVTRVAAAVDASLPVIEKAIAAGADLLVVHHGMFWQGVRMFTGAQYRKVKLAMDAGLAIYSSHIPLDIHPVIGNNVLLADALDLEITGSLMEWKGVSLGVSGEFQGTLGELRSKLERVLGGSVLLRGDENENCGLVGIITGGAGSEVEAVAEAGIQTFLTGEGPHWSHPLAEELQLNVFYAGHYATETFGVRRLAEVISKKYGVENTFIDHPTGL